MQELSFLKGGEFSIQREVICMSSRMQNLFLLLLLFLIKFRENKPWYEIYVFLA